jgi:hypothetical protein
MNSLSRTAIRSVAWVAAGMIIIVVFHIGGTIAHVVGQFSPLTGAFVGGSLTLFSAAIPMSKREGTEPWTGFERLSWLLIGVGVIMWGIGETFWRYYISIGQTPFPSLADIGYFSFPLLVFTALLLLPSPNVKSKRYILLMDSIISMGSIFAIAWYLLLGSLAQAPGEANLAKFLGIYYPVSDTALLSCVVFLLLRGQGSIYKVRARRISLLVVGLGLCFFVTSDFIFNIQQNAGTYVEATWIDLGWPLGMMIIGVAAALRRFLPSTPQPLSRQQQENRPAESALNPLTFVPYCLLVLLFVALAFDILSTDAGQVAVRPILLFATFAVVSLVIVRQIVVIRENILLTEQQAEALEDLEMANRRVEEQARQISEHNVELERGIGHLVDVQASLANGNLHARAHLTKGVLISLAGSLNIMAERLMRLGEATAYARRLAKALNDVSGIFEHATATGSRITIPESCADLLEIHRLLVALGMKRMYPAPPTTGQPKTSTSATNRPSIHPVTPIPPPVSPLPSHRPFVTEPLVHGSRQTDPLRHSELQPIGQKSPRTALGVQQSSISPALRIAPLSDKEHS